MGSRDFDGGGGGGGGGDCEDTRISSGEEAISMTSFFAGVESCEEIQMTSSETTTAGRTTDGRGSWLKVR